MDLFAVELLLADLLALVPLDAALFVALFLAGKCFTSIDFALAIFALGFAVLDFVANLALAVFVLGFTVLGFFTDFALAVFATGFSPTFFLAIALLELELFLAPPAAEVAFLIPSVEAFLALVLEAEELAIFLLGVLVEEIVVEGERLEDVFLAGEPAAFFAVEEADVFFFAPVALEAIEAPFRAFAVEDSALCAPP